MTNPYHQHGSSGFHGDSSNNLPTGLPGFGQRSSPYTSMTGGFSRVGDFAHLLNPVTSDAAADSHSYSIPPSSLDRDSGLRNGSEQNGSAGRSQAVARTQHLPSFSRAFEMFMRPPTVESQGPPSSNTGFFTPSYLRESTYMQRLEEAHKAKLQSQKEAQGGVGVGGGGGLSSQVGPGFRSRGSSLSLHSKLGSGRAMVHDGHDRQDMGSGAEDDESTSPLPSRWNKADKAANLDVLGDGLDVKYAGSRSSSERDHEACAIRADHYMPPQCGIYYFEVTVMSRKRDDTTICIGFSDRNVALARAPGWEPNSWGYHGDDGHIFAAQNVGKVYGPTFTAGDVVGCGVNFRTSSAFFTKNGEHLGTAFRDVKGSNLKLFPTIGLKKTGEHIRVNFGQTPFVFDIDGLMKKQRMALYKEIDVASTSNLSPLNESDLIQQLVLQFLQHDGYVETARAFAQEIQAQKQALNLDPDTEVEGINITDDEDANNRQRIRRAVLEGDIDRAFKYTNAYYPQVLKDNEPVHFRLRCRHFIEMIRYEAEMNMAGGGTKRANGHTQDLDDDMEMEDGVTGGHGDTGSIVDAALVYGQTLQAEYASDPRDEVHRALEDIFSLMAYENPLKEKEVAHLLDRKGRVAVAEELNSAILQSLGKSSRAALENVYSQTSVLLDDLRQGGGPGSFVTIQSVADSIPKSQPF